jgi:hypothetical protein
VKNIDVEKDSHNDTFLSAKQLLTIKQKAHGFDLNQIEVPGGSIMLHKA